jgi:hypothetical protein
MTPEIPTQILDIIPLQKTLDARVRVPGSKSLTNRALLIAALADGFSTLTNALFSDDSFYFANALQNLGFRINLEPEKASITVGGLSATWSPPCDSWEPIFPRRTGAGSLLPCRSEFGRPACPAERPKFQVTFPRNFFLPC